MERRPFVNIKNMKAHGLTLIIAIVLYAVISADAQQTDELSAYNEPTSRLRGVVEKYVQDYGSINRFYTAQTSAGRAARFRQLHSEYLALLGRLNFDSLNADEQVDYVLFRNYLDHERKELVRSEKQFAEMAPILPFARTISDLEDTRRRLETIDPAKIAALLTELSKQITETQKALEGADAKPKRTVANRAVRTLA